MTLKKYGFINIDYVKLSALYIKCLDCKKIGFNDDDSVCIYCGSKNTLRLTKNTHIDQMKLGKYV